MARERRGLGGDGVRIPLWRGIGMVIVEKEGVGRRDM